MLTTAQSSGSLSTAEVRTPASTSATAQGEALDHIMQIGLGFWASKTLLTAVELGVFTILAETPMNGIDLARKAGLNGRGAVDFLDALVALKFLDRRDGVYFNTPVSDLYLDRNKKTYAGGILEMANSRLYAGWGRLGEALRTGKPQNEASKGGDLFESIYSTPEKLESFLAGMTGISLGPVMAIADKFPWQDYSSFADIGTAQGALPVQVAMRHPHLTGIGYDLSKVQPVFEKYVRSHGLQDRVRFAAGDFFRDSLPHADVLVMGHILHDWNLEQKRELLAKAYAALPAGGALIIHESLIDDDRRENAFGLLMSLNMLIETPGGFDYTAHDCQTWMRAAGFHKTWVTHLVGPDSMVVGIK